MIFFSIILIVGVLTTFTDLKTKKIYNQHLALGAMLGLFAASYASVFNHENIFFHVTNGCVAFFISILLHRSALWRGGDAKLFTLYAFLMPPPAYNHSFFASAVSLFAWSFITGTLLLIPGFIKDIIANHSAIAGELFSPAKRRALFDATGTVIFSSWILFPIYYLARVTDSIMTLTVSYLFFSWGYSIPSEAKKDSIIEFLKKKSLRLSIFIIFGFLTRLWLSPASLSFSALSQYIIGITGYVVISAAIHVTFNHFKSYEQRIPFAPLLFIGCMLSYTPFLKMVSQAMTYYSKL